MNKIMDNIDENIETDDVTLGFPTNAIMKWQTV